MEAVRLFKSLDRDQRNTFVACFLGWALDAFDFFLLTFVIAAMAHDFGTSIAKLSYAITLTLAMRPRGAFIFALLGDGFGRRIPLITGMAASALRAKRLLEKCADRPATALGPLSLRDSLDDGVQRHVTWDPGHVSNVPRRTTPLRGDAKGGDRDHLRFWRDLRRNDCRSSLAKMGPASRDHFRSGVRHPSDSRLGLFAEFLPVGDWRICHAIHGARRMGNCACTLK